MKQWQTLKTGNDWRLLCDPERFTTFLQRAERNKNGITKFGPLQIRREKRCLTTKQK
jgi:hypothetical protein